MEHAGQGRQRAPHRERGRQQDERRQHQPHARPGQQPERHGAAQPDIDRVDQPDQRRRHRCAEGDEGLELAVKQEGIAQPIDLFAEHQATRTDPGHEDAQDRSRSGRGGAEDEPELPQPCGLVDERAEPGKEQAESGATGSPGVGGIISCHKDWSLPDL